MIYVALIKCKNGAKEMHKTGIRLRDYMLSFLCENYNSADIIKGEKGKPLYKGAGFSISHSSGAVCCAVSVPYEKENVPEDWKMLPIGDGTDVGIDIEPSDRRVYMPLARRFFSETEKEHIGCDATRFLEVWTKKESICKLTGEGIAGLKKPKPENVAVTTQKVSLDGREYVMSLAYYKNT